MEICIKIKKNRAKIFGNVPYDVLYRLDHFLSYKPVGIEYSPAYKQGRWDGNFRLLTKKLEFPSGLVERVKNFFEAESYKVEIEDYNFYKKYESFDILDRLSELNKTPRDYQTKAANVALSKKRGIIKIATGGGKSLVSALIVAEAGGKSVILVIGKDLLYQFHSFYEKVFQQEIGIVGDGICNIKNITIASIWSVGQAFGMRGNNIVLDDELPKEKRINKNYFSDIREMVREANLILMDEVHLSGAETVQKIGKGINSQYTIGMSASPWREDGSGLLINSIFGEIIINISASELIDKGYLVQPIIRFLPVPKLIGVGNNYRTVYKNYIVENEIRNNMIVKAGVKLIEQGFFPLVLFREINHGNILYEKFIEKKVNLELLNGKMSSKKRNEILRQANEGEIDLLLASTVADVGIDIPRLGALVNADSSKSKIKTLQRLGRILRPYKNKTIAPCIDFFNNCRYLKKHSEERMNTYKSENGFVVEQR
jgi:superfamily II DNA or RNA helicase